MMKALEQPKSAQDTATVYYDRTWEQFKQIQKGLEGIPGMRLSYYEEVVEIFTPGRTHEIFRKVIAALVESFFFHWRIQVIPTGSVTQEQEGIASAEADESYCFSSAKPIPDLSVTISSCARGNEVIFTSSSATKLRRYQALEVSEVWFWQDGLLTLHRLGENSYTRINRSQIPELEKLDIELLSRCVLIGETDWLEAVRTFRNAIANEQ